MRILFVTPYLPSRIRIRPFNFIKALSTRHEISLVSLICDDYELDLLPEIAPYCASVNYLKLARSGAYVRCLRALPTLHPLRVAYYQSASFARLVVQLAREHAIELVHGELVKVIPALTNVQTKTQLPCLYDAVDCMSSLLTQQQRNAARPWSKAFIASELYKLRRYEPRMFSRFEQVVITSTYERAYLLGLEVSRLYPRPVQVIANGVDVAYFQPPARPREPDLLVFCAKLDYAPNAQAIVDFCRDVLPLIWLERPQVHLEIVGCNPSNAIRALEVDRRIKIIGYVPDIRPYLGRASVALAPLKIAAGIQNKVLEAFAMATPLVATPRTCRALAVKRWQHLLLAEEPQDWADAVITLLENPALARLLGQAGREYVVAQHSWQRSALDLSKLYQDLVIGAPAI